MGLQPCLIVARFFLLLMVTGTCFANTGLQDDTRYRTFYQSGNIEYGKIDDSYTAELVMYIDVSQHAVTHDLIKNFQELNPDIATIYVATGSPARTLNNRILNQGYIHGKKISSNPDLFISTDLKHLQILKKNRLMYDYSVYLHNRPALMVAKGNPKRIKGIKDLRRTDISQCHPASVYSGPLVQNDSSLLVARGLPESILDMNACRDCWITENQIWLTSDYINHTPSRIAANLSDVGLVWATDVQYAQDKGLPVEGIALGQRDGITKHAKYYLGILSTSTNPMKANRYLDYLSSDNARVIFLKHGFIPATSGKLSLEPIPDTIGRDIPHQKFTRSPR